MHFPGGVRKTKMAETAESDNDSYDYGEPDEDVDYDDFDEWGNQVEDEVKHREEEAARQKKKLESLTKSAKFLPNIQELQGVRNLSQRQTNAIAYTVGKAKKKSDAARGALLKRVQGLGFTSTDFDTMLLYLRDQMPIIVHVPFHVITAFLVKDTHYRSCFETHTGTDGGNLPARAGWEESMFPNLYSDCPPFERVKYGVLNIVNDPRGILSCASYGDCYLRLRNVRLRTSFATGDSADATVQQGLATCEHMMHVLTSFSDSELLATLEVALGITPWHDSSIVATYKEVQIHGPVELATDVESVHVARSHEGQAEAVKKWAQEIGIDLVYIDPAPIFPYTPGSSRQKHGKKK